MNKAFRNETKTSLTSKYELSIVQSQSFHRYSWSWQIRCILPGSAPIFDKGLGGGRGVLSRGGGAHTACHYINLEIALGGRVKGRIKMENLYTDTEFIINVHTVIAQI